MKHNTLHLTNMMYPTMTTLREIQVATFGAMQSFELDYKGNGKRPSRLIRFTDWPNHGWMTMREACRVTFALSGYTDTTGVDL